MFYITDMLLWYYILWELWQYGIKALQRCRGENKLKTTELSILTVTKFLTCSSHLTTSNQRGLGHMHFGLRLSRTRCARALMHCLPVRRSSWGGKLLQTALWWGSRHLWRSAVAGRFHGTPALSGASPCSPPQSNLPVWGPTQLIVWSASGLCACHVWEWRLMRQCVNKFKFHVSQRADKRQNKHGKHGCTWWMSAREI